MSLSKLILTAFQLQRTGLGVQGKVGEVHVAHGSDRNPRKPKHTCWLLQCYWLLHLLGVRRIWTKTEQLPPYVYFRSLETQASKLQNLNFRLSVGDIMVICPYPSYGGCWLLMAHIYTLLSSLLYTSFPQRYLEDYAPPLCPTQGISI